MQSNANSAVYIRLCSLVANYVKNINSKVLHGYDFFFPTKCSFCHFEMVNFGHIIIKTSRPRHPFMLHFTFLWFNCVTL